MFVLGRRPYAELPAYSRGFHASHRSVPHDGAHALRQPDQAARVRRGGASDRLVAAARSSEVRDIATCATTFDDWVDALRAAVARGQRSGRASQRNRSASRTTTGRIDVQDIARLVNDVGARRRARGRALGPDARCISSTLPARVRTFQSWHRYIARCASPVGSRSIVHTGQHYDAGAVGAVLRTARHSNAR